jgi:hypothetical protein
MIRATLVLYRDSLTDAAKAIVRGPAAWVGSLLIGPLTTALAMTAGQIPILGGFIVGFASCWFYGAYLYMLQESMQQRRPIGWAIMRESLGHYIWEVIGVGFVALIGSMALGWLGLPQMVTVAVGLVCFVLFNPWPEIIYRERTAGTMDILVRSARWMSQHGPEWIIPHLVVAGLAWGVWSGAASTILFLGGGLLLHPWMAFRGALYRHLNTGSRRSREWRARF